MKKMNKMDKLRKNFKDELNKRSMMKMDKREVIIKEKNEKIDEKIVIIEDVSEDIIEKKKVEKISESCGVVNVKKENLKKMGYNDFEHWAKDDSHVYIGRNMSFYVKGAVGSKWANKFSVKKYSRDGCLEMYKEYIKKSDLYNELDELEGKVLGCWCKPERCHGDVLMELLREKKGN